jgi:hypothetical protein
MSLSSPANVAVSCQMVSTTVGCTMSMSTLTRTPIRCAVSAGTSTRRRPTWKLLMAHTGRPVRFSRARSVLMTFRRRQSPKTSIQSDGRTVWVHSSLGHTIGRFGSLGIDVHTADSTGCLDCTHGPTGVIEWDRFVVSMAVHHGVDVGLEHMPVWLGRAEKGAESDGS